MGLLSNALTSTGSDLIIIAEAGQFYKTETGKFIYKEHAINKGQQKIISVKSLDDNKDEITLNEGTRMFENLIQGNTCIWFTNKPENQLSFS